MWQWLLLCEAIIWVGPEAKVEFSRVQVAGGGVAHLGTPQEAVNW